MAARSIGLLVRTLVIASGLLLLCGSTVSLAVEPSALVDANLTARTVVSTGDLARLQHVLAKARRGEAVTIGVIGGSITQGASASDAEHRYGNLVARWWREKFPQSTIKFVNAGIGATGSNYGALRAARDLLSAQPDFVVVEYAVNDVSSQDAAETLEGLVRQILKQPNQPAVLLLFMMRRNGNNAQEWFSKVGLHYGLPMISYRDAFWPEIEGGRLKWEDISPDDIHPNNRGHAAAAHFVTARLESTLATLPADDQLASAPSVPAALLTDTFEFTSLMEAAAMRPLVNEGWAYDEATKCWKSTTPGSVLEFEVEGRVIFTMHYVVRGPMGRAKVSVDGAPLQTLDGWFDQTWGGYRQTNRVARDLAPGKHRVRFELSAEKNKGSDGTEFRVLGLGTAGIESGLKAPR